MANFARVKALGWSLYDLLASALMNKLDDDHTKAPNFDEGSSHSPTDWIELNGANGYGLQFTDAPIDGDITVPVAVTLKGAGGLVLGTTGTPLPFGGFITGSPTQLVWRGSPPVFEGGITLDGTGDNASLLYLVNSADMQVAANCTVRIDAAASLESYGTVTVRAGSSLVVEGHGTPGSGSTVTSATNALWQLAGATLTASGPWTFTGTLAGTHSRTGALTLSGTSATTAVRTITGANANTTYSAADADIVEVPDSLTNATTYLLKDNPAPPDGLTILFTRSPPEGIPHTCTLRRETSNAQLFDLPGNHKSFALCYTKGGVWHVGPFGTTGTVTVGN